MDPRPIISRTGFAMDGFDVEGFEGFIACGFVCCSTCNMSNSVKNNVK